MWNTVRELKEDYRKSPESLEEPSALGYKLVDRCKMFVTASGIESRSQSTAMPLCTSLCRHVVMLMLCSIDNPFLTFDDTTADTKTGRTQLQEYVHAFTARARLQHRYELLLLGARIARDKHDAMTNYSEGIPEPEKELIRREKETSNSFWKQAKFFKATSM